MKFLPICVALLFAGAANVVAEQDVAESVKLAGQVREIFEAKCIDCHGPELPRPKGKFGYVLDLKRVADNAEYIVRGDAEKSDLYVMVRDNEMPGEDAPVPPLTDEEKEIVKRWIESGAPDAPTARTAEPVTVAAPAPKRDWPLWKRGLEWIGRFHPVSTHFPIALMLVAVFAEGLAWWTRREWWLQTVRFLVTIAAFGGVAAAALGWVNAWFSSYTGALAPVLAWHRWLGTIAALWAAICASLAVLGECKEGSKERQRFRGALLLGAILIGIVGFLGSALIYGLDHYSWE